MQPKITTPYMELQPAYGRDYKSQKEAIDAFQKGKDWTGDITVGFALCSVRDFEKGTPVTLRYKKNTKIAVTKV
jgi:hypothetical protein